MSAEQGRDYHVARARAEIDRAYRAKLPQSAAAHMHLSSLHLEQARSLGEPLPEFVAKDLDWLQDFAALHARALSSARA